LSPKGVPLSAKLWLSTRRGYLRRFLFTAERINTRIDQLSGGERSRVLLAKILKRGGNVLILDEPTNDLDLGTLRLLEEALVAFRGNVPPPDSLGSVPCAKIILRRNNLFLYCALSVSGA